MLSQDSADSGVTLDPHRDPSFAKFFKSGDVEFYRRDYEGVIRHTVGADRLKEGSINYPTLYLVKVDDQGDTVGKVTYLYTFKKNYTNGVSSRCRIRGDPCMGKIEQISDMDVQGVEYDAVIDIPNTNGEIVFECRGDGYVRYRTPQSYYFQGFIVDGGDNDPIITTIKSQSSGMFHSGSYLSYTVVNPNNAASLGSLSVGDGEGGVTEGSVNNNFRIYVVYPKDEKQQVKLLHYFVGCDDASRQKLDSDHILSAETYFTNDTNHAMLSSKYTPTQLTLTQGDDINEADELSVLHALITERDKIKESLPQLFSNVSKAEKDEESKVLLFKEAYYEAAARLAEIEKESAARDEARNVSPADTGIPAATAVDDKVAASDKAAIDDSDKVAIGDDKSAAVIPPNEEMLVDLRRQTKERDEAIAAKEAADEELRIAWGRIKELEAKLDARTGEGDDEIESEKSYTALSQTKWSYDVAMSQLKSNMKKNHNIDDLNLFENQVMVINSGTSIYIGIPPGQFDDLPRTCCKEKQINKQRVVFYHEVKYKDKLDNVFELVKTESEKVLNESSSRDDVLRIATESLLTDKIQAKLKKSIPVVPGGEHSILQYYAIRYQLYDHKRRNNEIPCLCFDPNCNERMDRRTHSVVGSISGKCATKWINLRPSALGEGVDFSFCDDPYSGKEDCRVMFTGLYHASTLLASKRIAVTFHGTVVERLIRSRITEIRAGKKVINERHTSTRSVLDKNAARKRASNAKKKKKKLLAPVLVEVDGKKGIFQPELTKSKLRYAILVFGNALAKAMEAAKDGRFALLGYISDTTMDENGNPMANEQFRHLVRVDNNPVILQGPKGNGQKLRLEHIGTPEEAEMNEQILLPITVVSVETLGGLEGETLERKLQKYFIKKFPGIMTNQRLGGGQFVRGRGLVTLCLMRYGLGAQKESLALNATSTMGLRQRLVTNMKPQEDCKFIMPGGDELVENPINSEGTDVDGKVLDKDEKEMVLDTDSEDEESEDEGSEDEDSDDDALDDDVDNNDKSTDVKPSVRSSRSNRPTRGTAPMYMEADSDDDSGEEEDFEETEGSGRLKEEPPEINTTNSECVCGQVHIDLGFYAGCIGVDGKECPNDHWDYIREECLKRVDPEMTELKYKEGDLHCDDCLATIKSKKRKLEEMTTLG